MDTLLPADVAVISPASVAIDVEVPCEQADNVWQKRRVRARAWIVGHVCVCPPPVFIIIVSIVQVRLMDNLK
jgi:hypothetical protein